MNGIDRQAGCEVLQALRNGQRGGGVGSEDLALSKEPDDEAVQTLRAGDDLHDHRLTELAGIFRDETCAGLTGDAGALCRADARESRCERSAEKAESQTTDGFEKCHFQFPP